MYTLYVMFMFQLLGVWMNELIRRFPSQSSSLSLPLSLVGSLKFILAGWLMQMSERHRRRASMFAFRQVSFVLRAGMLTGPQLSWRKSLIDSPSRLADCGLITGWLVKTTRMWWEEEDWGTGLYFTNICSWLQVFFPSVASAVTSEGFGSSLPHDWSCTRRLILTAWRYTNAQRGLDFSSLLCLDLAALFCCCRVFFQKLGQSICQVGGSLPAVH